MRILSAGWSKPPLESLDSRATVHLTCNVSLLHVLPR